MELPLSFAKLLQLLLTENDLNHSLFKGSKTKLLLSRFIEDGVLDYSSKNGLRKRIFCPDKNNLVRYLHQKHSIHSLDDYIETLQNEFSERSDMARAAGNTKIIKKRILEGFLVNCYTDVSGTINGRPINLLPVDGSYFFINSFRDFKVPAEVTIVSVEGYQNFRDVSKQKHLFGDRSPLFIWRYQNSNTIAEWLNRIPNQYIHFGDFDPKGLHIYISEFRRKLSPERCSLFVPVNLEEMLIKYGDRELYEQQIEHLKNIDFELYPEVRSVWNLIFKHRKGLEQEIFIDTIRVSNTTESHF